MTVNDNHKVVRFSGKMKANFSAAEVLRFAAEQNFEDVIVIGRRSTGQLAWDASPEHVQDINFMLDIIKADLLL